MSISKELLAGWSPLPSDGAYIHLSKNLDDLPFICTTQHLWLSLTNRFNIPSETDKIHLKDLNRIASVLIKLIDNCLCPEPTMIAQVADFCVPNRIKKIKEFLEY